MPRYIVYGILVANEAEFVQKVIQLCIQTDVFIKYRIYKLVPVPKEEKEKDDEEITYVDQNEDSDEDKMDEDEKEEEEEYKEKTLKKGITTSLEYNTIIQEHETEESLVHHEEEQCTETEVSEFVSTMNHVKNLKLFEAIGWHDIKMRKFQDKWILYIGSSITQVEDEKGIFDIGFDMAKIGYIVKTQVKPMMNNLGLPSCKIYYVNL